MIKRKRSINSIIHDQLLGYASEEDKKQLQSWLDSSQENRENYDRLMREACLIDRYKQFAQVDEERAWERFQKKHFSIRSARWVKIGRYAAIFLLLDLQDLTESPFAIATLIFLVVCFF